MHSSITFILNGFTVKCHCHEPQALVVYLSYKLGSIKALAEAAGVTRTTVYRWLNGKLRPTDENYQRLLELAWEGTGFDNKTTLGFSVVEDFKTFGLM